MTNKEYILQKETQYGTKERTAQKEGEDPTGNASKTPDTISDLLLERDMQAFRPQEKETRNQHKRGQKLNLQRLRLTLPLETHKKTTPLLTLRRFKKKSKKLVRN